MTIPLYNLHVHENASPPLKEEVRILSLAWGKDGIALKPDIHYSIGIHPWYLPKGDKEETLRELRKLASHPQIVAIGECGLDKLCESSIDLQKEFFACQIQLATEIQKPLILHVVKAWQELLETLKEKPTNLPIVIHRFRGKPQLASQLLEKGFYLSFGEHYHKASLQLAYSHKRLFLETDTSPLPIQAIYQKASRDLGIPMEMLRQSIKENAKTIGLLSSPLRGESFLVLP